MVRLCVHARHVISNRFKMYVKDDFCLRLEKASTTEGVFAVGKLRLLQRAGSEMRREITHKA